MKAPSIVTDRRFVAGAVLLASALLGLYAFRGAEAATTPVLAAAHDISTGQLIGSGDLAEATVRVDGPARRHLVPVDRREVIDGQVAVRRIAAGQLLQDGDTAPGGPGRREVSVPVGADHVPSGRIQPGDLVDILATYGDAASVRTVVVARGVEVVGVTAQESFVEARESGPVSAITVATDARTASLLVFASRSAKVDVVKAVGPSEGGDAVGYDDLGAESGGGR